MVTEERFFLPRVEFPEEADDFLEERVALFLPWDNIFPALFPLFEKGLDDEEDVVLGAIIDSLLQKNSRS